MWPLSAPSAAVAIKTGAFPAGGFAPTASSAAAAESSRQRATASGCARTAGGELAALEERRATTQQHAAAGDPWEDFYGMLPPAPEPTNAQPGSEEKIEVMRKRLEEGYHLHHAGDAKMG